MGLILLIASYLGLLCFLWFCNLNVLFHMRNQSGFEYLFAFFVAAATVFVFGKSASKFRPNIGVGLVVAFFVYFLFASLFDGMDFESVFAYLFGSTGGMFFSFVCGLFVCVLVNEVYVAGVVSRLGRKFFHVLSLAVVSWVVYENFMMLQEFLNGVRVDLFLLEDRDLSYQRIGNYIVIRLMVILSLVVMVFSLRPLSFILRAVFIGLSVLDLINIFLVSQLVGSNSSAVISVGLYVFTFLFLLVTGEESVCKINSLFNSIYVFFRLCCARWKEIGVFFGVGFFIILGVDFDWDSIRLFGYGANTSTSFDSRAEIFDNYLWLHVLYNPVFGNTLVDSITTGEGSYVHSIPVSVQTHLGVIGLSIFVALNYKTFNKIKQGINYCVRTQNPAWMCFYYFYLGLALVLLAGTMSAFFNWMPYWFSIGFWGGWYLKKDAHE